MTIRRDMTLKYGIKAMVGRIFKYFDGLHAGGQADGDISKEEWITGFATFIKGDPSYSLLQNRKTH